MVGKRGEYFIETRHRHSNIPTQFSKPAPLKYFLKGVHNAYTLVSNVNEKRRL